MGNLVLRSIRLFYSAMSCDDPEADYGAHQSDGESVVDDGPKLKPVSFLVNGGQEKLKLEARFCKLIGVWTLSSVTTLKRLKSGIFQDEPAAKKPKTKAAYPWNILDSDEEEQSQEKVTLAKSSTSSTDQKKTQGPLPKKYSSSAVGDGDNDKEKTKKTEASNFKADDVDDSWKDDSPIWTTKFERGIFADKGLLYDILRDEADGLPFEAEGGARFFIRLGMHDDDMKWSLKINFDRWTNFLKENSIETIRKRLGSAIPKMPRRKSWPLAASGYDLNPNKVTEFKGMMAKYNYEFRRPFLTRDDADFPKLDTWTMQNCTDATAFDRLEFLRGPFFRVNIRDVFELADAARKHQVAVGTLSESRHQLDWQEWRRQPSSMVVPTTTTGIYFVRSVLTIGFASLCLILKDMNSVAEIEEAWLQMPKVKPKKTNRGTSTGGAWHHSWVGTSWDGGQSDAKSSSWRA